MKYLSLVAVVAILMSCSVKEEKIVKKEIKQNTTKVDTKEFVKDLLLIPQNVDYYSQNIAIKNFSSQKDYERNFFNVWSVEKIQTTLNDAMWAHKRYKAGDTYGENLQLLDASFYSETLKNANYENYATLNKRAVSLKRLNIRAMPSNKPILLDPTKAGEGFPFDYLQNSSIAANKPLLVSHYSKDGEWAFIESSFTFGWVKSRNIAVIDKKYTELWKHAEQIFIIKEGVSIYSQDNKFLFKSRIGMMLALVDEDAESYTVLTIAKYKSKTPLYVKSKISKEIAHKGKLEFTTLNINNILKEVSKKNYGWGGIYGQRDCSSTLRDFYTPFGLWLPRNSFKQSQVGVNFSFNGFNNKEKIAFIKKNALPFRTLLYKKGHIVLYVGTYNNEIVIYQNIWGIKTKIEGEEGRFIVGKPVFSTLTIGSNLKNYDINSSLLTTLQSMTTL